MVWHSRVLVLNKLQKRLHKSIIDYGTFLRHGLDLGQDIAKPGLILYLLDTLPGKLDAYLSHGMQMD